MYDAFILTLSALGIATVLVYSYKIAHSPLRTVGIVRELPESQKSGVDSIRHAGSTGSPMWSMSANGKETWRCEGCGLVQSRSTDFQCRRCKEKSALRFVMAYEIVGDSGPDESAQSALEGEVAQHGETLKAHSRLFKDIEKRLRQVELESVKRSQEAVEEHPQTSQTEFIH
jgi:hypothetical protein